MLEEKCTDSPISEPSNYALSALPKPTGIRGGGGCCTDDFDPGCVICGITPCSACCDCTCCHLGGNAETGPGYCYKCCSCLCLDCGCDIWYYICCGCCC
ncbi:unnamed protein product [Rotaria sp. Silwood1]|nr:unnamed protein product [Rotaria sp. Silwood1]CAF1655723.1 unnamed protein product [Rotaria sp. Silwood1]